MLMDTPICEFGWNAPDFTLKDARGDSYRMSDYLDGKGLLIAFICNHCPYVLHLNDEMVQLAKEYQAKGVGFVVISSNDIERYPQDAPDKMKIFAEASGFWGVWCVQNMESVPERSLVELQISFLSDTPCVAGWLLHLPLRK